MHRSMKNRVRLGMEVLENRACPALLGNATAQVFWDPNQGNLVVTGTKSKDSIAFIQNDTTDVLSVRVNGVERSFPSSQVKTILVNAKGGNDSVNYSLGDGSDFINGKTIRMDLGTGNDSAGVDLYFSSRDGETTRIATISGNLDLNVGGGSGIDCVCFRPGHLTAPSLKLRGDLGQGWDWLCAYLPISVGSTSTIDYDFNGGGGNDVLGFWGNCNVNDGSYARVAPGASVNIKFGGGAGNDRLLTRFGGAMQGTLDVTMDGGAGNDYIDAKLDAQAILGPSTGTIKVTHIGGEGNDNCILTRQGYDDATLALLMDGGIGEDFAVASVGVMLTSMAIIRRV